MRCPVCKAENADAPQCRRCKADLSLLVALEQRRAQALTSAAARLARGDIEAALRAAVLAHRLRRDDESERLLTLARLLTGDYGQAFAWYRSRASLGVGVDP